MKREAEMTRLLNGYQVSQALHVAAVLGLSDRLAGDGMSAQALAQDTRCEPRSLYRLLHALSTIGVYVEEPAGWFRSTELGDTLRGEGAGGLAGWAAFVGEPSHWQAWGALLHSVRTGENAFESVHGENVWDYRNTHLEAGKTFDAAMTARTSVIQDAVVAAYDFSRFETLVDVGGGHGGLLAAVLGKNAEMRGVLFDQPQVVAGAGPLLSSAGVQDRCDIVGGSFFDSVPEGADAYALKAIIHDWDDERAREILRVCRAAMSSGATLLIVERLLDAPETAAQTAFSDLNMLVGPGGQERTEAEYAALFGDCRFSLERVVRTASPFVVVEGVPV